ncbi:MAG TPA: biopolymer transporter ExbD [Lentisphaeria bacterium]|nr:biopolymer transporter ExbD [Lentisphaeria bacterium]
MFRTHSSRQLPETDSDVNMTPLIDMVFILLIFFLVTATFEPDPGIQLERATATHTNSVPSESMRIAISANNQAYIGGRAVDRPQLERAVRTFVGNSPQGSVAIVPDRRADAGTLVELMDLVREAGIDNVAVVTQAPAH